MTPTSALRGPDRRFTRLEVYQRRRHYVPNDLPASKRRPLPQLVWAPSNVTRNRAMHALNGNTAAASSSAAANADRPGTMTAQERTDANRQAALARRALRHRRPGLHIPFPPAGSQVPAAPARPRVFRGWRAPHVEARLLSDLNRHPRDARVRFDPGPHVYYVDGLPTLGSVTGLIHRYAGEFDPPTVIERMKRGRNWSRT